MVKNIAKSLFFSLASGFPFDNKPLLIKQTFSSKHIYLNAQNFVAKFHQVQNDGKMHQVQITFGENQKGNAIHSHRSRQNNLKDRKLCVFHKS